MQITPFTIKIVDNITIVTIKDVSAAETKDIAIIKKRSELNALIELLVLILEHNKRCQFNAFLSVAYLGYTISLFVRVSF